MRISDLMSDVCSSDLRHLSCKKKKHVKSSMFCQGVLRCMRSCCDLPALHVLPWSKCSRKTDCFRFVIHRCHDNRNNHNNEAGLHDPVQRSSATRQTRRSEEHTSELQSLMRISYAVFCLKKK